LSNKAKFSKLVGLPQIKTVASTADYGAELNEGECGKDSCTKPHEEE
jgi:hypothetical protein